MKRRISRGKTKRVMPQASARLSSSQIVQLLILTFITNQPTRLCPVHARLDCHAPPFDALFQPQPARPRYDNHRRVYLEVLLSTLTSSVPPMGNIFTKFLLPLHSHRHARPSTPCPNTLTRAPSHLTLPRTFQSSRKPYAFSGFGVIHSSLLRIYAPWSLSELSIVPFHLIQFDLVLLPPSFPSPSPSPQNVNDGLSST